MKENPWLLKNAVPLSAYVFIILAIFLAQLYLPAKYVISIAAMLMLFPVLLKTDGNWFRHDPRGVAIGIIVSVVLLLIYAGIIFFYGLYEGKTLSWNHLSVSFILTQLLLVALPEEVFFRGYLQTRLGNNIKGIIIVSFLFAVGHFITLCLGGGHSISICAQSILTFFPSLVMGYLYFATKSLWASIIFHFFANIVHIAITLN